MRAWEIICGCCNRGFHLRISLLNLSKGARCMSRHLVDTSTRYSGTAYETLSDDREIEDPEVDVVAPENPPKKRVPCEPYLPDEKLVEVVNLAIALGRPLLLQGDPGCGKTRL